MRTHARTKKTFKFLCVWHVVSLLKGEYTLHDYETKILRKMYEDKMRWQVEDNA